MLTQAFRWHTKSGCESVVDREEVEDKRTRGHVIIFCRRHVTAFADVLRCLVIALPIFDSSCPALLISTTTALETIE
jgi:hypothetical protein